MKLCRADEVPESSTGHWFRESRVAGVVRFLVFSGLLLIAPILGWHYGYSIVFWGGIVVALLLFPLLLGDVAAQFRPGNWVLCIDADGVWINLRSYRDRPADDASVVRLTFGEIATAARHTEVYSTPSKTAGPGSQGAVGGSTLWRDEFLELRLAQAVTDELVATLNRLRHPAATGEGNPRRLPPRPKHFTVWLAKSTVLRVAWISGHGHVVTPPVSEALRHLDGHVHLGEAVIHERPSWRNLTPAEADELARELIQVQGASIDASTLLVRAGGLSSSEAMQQVLQIEAEPIGGHDNAV
jgi:hypothetical protein